MDNTRCMVHGNIQYVMHEGLLHSHTLHTSRNLIPSLTHFKSWHSQRWHLHILTLSNSNTHTQCSQVSQKQEHTATNMRKHMNQHNVKTTKRRVTTTEEVHHNIGGVNAPSYEQFWCQNRTTSPFVDKRAEDKPLVTSISKNFKHSLRVHAKCARAHRRAGASKIPIFSYRPHLN